MPSIFIWKSETPNTSKKQIRYYSGSNWALEDYDFTSKSYMLLDQIVIPGFNNSVITHRAKLMPQDWTGSDLLEVSVVPYEHIKSDNYGTLERIGCWMRFTSKNEIEFDEDSLKSEIKQIEKWMLEKKSFEKTLPEKKYSQKQPIHHQNIQTNFQEFLIKYTMPVQTNLNTHQIMKKNNNPTFNKNRPNPSYNKSKIQNKSK